MTNNQIAELVAQILTSAVTSTNVEWALSDIISGYEKLFKTIKRMDQS